MWLQGGWKVACLLNRVFASCLQDFFALTAA